MGKGYQTRYGDWGTSSQGKGGPDITLWKGVPDPVRGLGDQQSGKRGTRHYVRGKGYQTRYGDWGTMVVREEGGPDITSWERGTRPDKGDWGTSSQGKGGPDITSWERGTRPGKGDWGTSSQGKGGPDITSGERGIRPGPRTGGPRGTKYYVMGKGDQTSPGTGGPAVREKRGTRYHVRGAGYYRKGDCL
jgi:hypothetical protein